MNLLKFFIHTQNLESWLHKNEKNPLKLESNKTLVTREERFRLRKIMNKRNIGRYVFSLTSDEF